MVLIHETLMGTNSNGIIQLLYWPMVSATASNIRDMGGILREGLSDGCVSAVQMRRLEVKVKGYRRCGEGQSGA